MVLIKKAKTGILAFILVVMAISGKAQDLAEANELYNAGVNLVNEEKLSEALEKFIKVVEICEVLEDEAAIETKMTVEGVIPGVQFKIAQNYIDAGDFENGITALEKTIEYSESYFDNTTKDKAVSILSKVYFKNAYALMKQGNVEEAETHFNKVLEMDPDYSSVFYAKAMMYRQVDNEELFKENIAKAIESATKTNDRKTLNGAVSLGANFYLKKGLDAFNGGKYDDCIDFLNTSLEFDPNQPDALFMQVQAYGKKQDWNQTIALGNKALAAEDGNVEKKARIYFEMANAYKEKEDKESACECYKNAMYGQYVENAKYQIEHILKCAN